jgi:hypothetical protein
MGKKREILMDGKTVDIRFGNSAKNISDIARQIEYYMSVDLGLETKHYGDIEGYYDECGNFCTRRIPESINCICSYWDDLGNYYRPNGAKVTKYLKTILVKKLGIDFNTIEDQWPTFCNHVASLYWTDCTFRVSINPKKEEIGNGIWESYDTCFGYGGCNELNGKYVAINKRFKLITFELVTDEEVIKAGRVICYLPGNRGIYLFNWYFKNGITQDTDLISKAVAHLFGINEYSINYVENDRDFRLPIYQNGDTIIIVPKRNSVPSRYTQSDSRIFLCPVCGRKMRETRMITGISGSSYYVACSDRCMSELGTRTCDECGDHIHPDDVFAHNDHIYCENCFHDIFTYCSDCEEVIYQDDATYINSQVYCSYCRDQKYTSCDKCGEYIKTGDSYTLSDGSSFCQGCFERYCYSCDDCGECYYLNDGYKETREGIFCMDCADKHSDDEEEEETETA